MLLNSSEMAWLQIGIALRSSLWWAVGHRGQVEGWQDEGGLAQREHEQGAEADHSVEVQKG